MTQTRRFAVGVVAGFLVSAAVANARPVHIGRFEEIAYGISRDHPWNTGGGDRTRSYRSDHRAADAAPHKLWDARVGVGRVAAPALNRDGLLFVGSQAGVTAVGPDGNVRWAVRLGLVSGTPSLTPEGNVAVGGQPGELLVLGRAQTLVHSTIGGGVRGSVLVLDDGSMVVAAYDQALHRYDVVGRELFRSRIATQVRGGVALSANGQLVMPAGRQLLFFSTRGVVVRSVPLGGESLLGPAVGPDGTIWVATIQGTLVGVSSAGRPEVRAELEVRPSGSSNLAVAADGSVRLGTQDAGIVCVGPGGSERWRYGNTDFAGGVSVDAAMTTLTVSATGRLVALDSSGRERWSVDLGSRTDAAPVVGTDGTIYIGTFAGTLQAWR